MDNKMFNPEDFKNLTPEQQKEKFLDMLIQSANPDAFRTVEIPYKDVRFLWTQISKAGMALLLLNKPEDTIDDQDRENLRQVMSDFTSIIPEKIDVSFENRSKILTLLTAVILASADQLAQASKLDKELLMFSRPDELAKKLKDLADADKEEKHGDGE